MSSRVNFFAFMLGSAALSAGPALAQETIDRNRVEQGFAISPIPTSHLSLNGKDIELVGYGSYLVNAMGDCSGCHSFPQYLAKGDTAGSNPAAGDPYQGTPSTQSVTGQLLGASTAPFFRAYEQSGWSVPITGRIDFPIATGAVSPQFLTSGGLDGATPEKADRRPGKRQHDWARFKKSLLKPHIAGFLALPKIV